ncbi:hypothetical protein ACIRQY_32160 [Streptomyces sp. NPDC101490]|uniref:hypothetical protein n=1 Tax=unclassified Streptomyces TaxID=2593676 RepID=UPI003320ED99
MTSTLIRGGVALAFAALAVLTPTVAHADAGIQETQVFTATSYEQSAGKATREAENTTRRHALISGYTNEQCVVLYAYSSRAGYGWWDGYAALRCTR